MSTTPFIIIHLSIQKKSDKKKDTKKKKEIKEGEEEVPEEPEEEDKNRVIYKPSIKDCENFIPNSMDMVITSTNHINDLECDLMPFLQKIGYSNFKID
jgi:hypothetical protein